MVQEDEVAPPAASEAPAEPPAAAVEPTAPAPEPPASVVAPPAVEAEAAAVVEPPAEPAAPQPAADELAEEELEREREKRVEHLTNVAIRRIALKDLARGWSGWHDMWSQKVRQRNLLCDALGRQTSSFTGTRGS